jgi:predicted ArsR family transcriptional regulator
VHDRTPEETAEVALSLADEYVAGVMRQLRRRVRQEATARLLGDSQYRVGAEMCRRIGWPEAAVHDAVMETAEILDDDPYFAWEDAFGFDQRLLDRLEPGEEA